MNIVANKAWAHLRGFNYQPSYGSTGYELWRSFDAKTIDLELARGKKYFPAMNAIRLWLSWDAFLREPAQFAANFETALAIADGHGLAVMPVLFNRWHDVLLDYGGIYIDHFLPGGRFMGKADLFDAYMETIVGGHAADPRVFSWDLCNEPFEAVNPGGVHALPAVEQPELDWLQRLYEQCKQLGAKAPVTVGTHPQYPLENMDRCSDFLCVHPYWETYFQYPGGISFEELIDSWVAFANKVNKPLLASETCWGSQDDARRVEVIRYTLGELRRRDIGFLVYLLHHSLIADAHRIEFGPVGRPGNLSFIEANGSLRPGHEVWNDFAG